MSRQKKVIKANKGFVLNIHQLVGSVVVVNIPVGDKEGLNESAECLEKMKTMVTESLLQALKNCEVLHN